PYSLATALAWRNMPGLSDTSISGDVITRAPDGREIVNQVSLTRTINGASVNLRSPNNEYPAFIVLNDWAANDLGAKINDDVQIEYYLWEQEGRLVTKTASLRVAGITPMQGRAADRNLSPAYPGLTGTDRLAGLAAPVPVH